MIKTTVFCKLQVDGTHFWSGVPDELEDVQYLKSNHRHMFGFKCYAEVFHGDRDIEFINLKHKVTDYLRKEYYNEELHTHVFGPKSCEHLGKELMEKFELCKIEVDEDGENGMEMVLYK